MLYCNLLQNTETSCSLQPRLFDLRTSCQMRSKGVSALLFFYLYLVVVIETKKYCDRLGAFL